MTDPAPRSDTEHSNAKHTAVAVSALSADIPVKPENVETWNEFVGKLAKQLRDELETVSRASPKKPVTEEERGKIVSKSMEDKGVKNLLSSMGIEGEKQQLDAINCLAQMSPKELELVTKTAEAANKVNTLIREFGKKVEEAKDLTVEQKAAKIKEMRETLINDKLDGQKVNPNGVIHVDATENNVQNFNRKAEYLQKQIKDIDGKDKAKEANTTTVVPAKVTAGASKGTAGDQVIVASSGGVGEGAQPKAHGVGEANVNTVSVPTGGQGQGRGQSVGGLA